MRRTDVLVIKGTVWPYDIVVGMGISREKLIQLMERRYHDPFTPGDKENLLKGTPRGRTIQLDNNAVVVWCQHFPTTSHQFAVLQHELFHAATMVLHYAGLTLSEESDEAWAYFIEYITKVTYAEYRLV